MSTNQWHQYQLVIKMLKDQYGDLTPLTQEAYNKKRESGSYIGHNILNQYVAYFFFETSKMIANLGNFRSLIDQSLARSYRQVIIFIPFTLTSSINKFIQESNLRTRNQIIIYELKHFNIEPGRGPHCGLHEIMTQEEIETEITRQLHVSVRSLKRIALNDAQLQFLRPKVGDVIRIKKKNPVCGEIPDYRLVTKPMEKGEAVQSKSEDSDAESEGSQLDDDDDEESDDDEVAGSAVASEDESVLSAVESDAESDVE